MCVEVGDALFLDHDIAWICNLFAYPPQHLQRTQWTPGLPGLSSFRASFLRHQASITSFVALVRSSRICSIELYGFSGWQLEKVLPAMRQPFSEMAYLLLHCEDDTAPVIPDSFISGCAPRLRYLELERIPFPRLPKLLLSAIHIIELHLSIIPHSGHISPESMVTGLSMKQECSFMIAPSASRFYHRQLSTKAPR
jgi:hypothetical protein